MIIVIPTLLKIVLTLANASISLAITICSKSIIQPINNIYVPLLILIASEYLSSISNAASLLTRGKISWYVTSVSTIFDILSTVTGLFLFQRLTFKFNDTIGLLNSQSKELLIALEMIFMTSLLLRFYQATIMMVGMTSNLSNLDNEYQQSAVTYYNPYDIEKSSRVVSSETETDKNTYTTTGESYKTVNFKPSSQTLVASMAEKIPLEDMFTNYHHQQSKSNEYNTESTEDLMLPSRTNSESEIQFNHLNVNNEQDECKLEQTKIIDNPKLLPAFTRKAEKEVISNNEFVPPFSPTYNNDISMMISRVAHTDSNSDVQYIETSPARLKKSFMPDQLILQKGQVAELKPNFNAPIVTENGSIDKLEDDQRSLGDLREIPALVNGQWPHPSSSPTTSSPVLSNAETLETMTKKINHISLDSWNKNSENWENNRLRMNGTHPSFYNKPQLPKSQVADNPNVFINAGSFQRPTLIRSFSEPSVTSSSDSIHTLDLNTKNLMLRDGFVDSGKWSMSSSNEQASKHSSLQSIVNQSFFVSYENISKMAMQNKPNLEAPQMNNINNSDGFKISSRSRTSTITSNVNTNLSPSSTVKHSRSHSNSPLKSLRSLKNFKSSLSLRGNKEDNENQTPSFSPTHLNYGERFNMSSSKDQDMQDMFTNFDFLGNTQRSSSPQGKYHHAKTKSTISLKTPTRKNSMKSSAGLNKSFSLTRFKSDMDLSSNASKFKRQPKTAAEQKDLDADVTIMEQMHQVDSFNCSGTPESNWSEGSNKSNFPSVVIGQYDREKWKRIKNKLLEEADSSVIIDS